MKVRFHILTAVKMTVTWDVAPRSLVEADHNHHLDDGGSKHFSKVS
jgi:hypothetical protein